MRFRGQLMRFCGTAFVWREAVQIHNNYKRNLQN